MSTYSTTSTYTVADVEKVVRSVKADLIIIATTSKAMTEDEATNYAHDIEILAKRNYIECVDVTLMSGSSEVRAIKYEFQTEGATGADRPGGVVWPLTPKVQGGWIRIILRYTDSASAGKLAELPLKITWFPSSTDTSHKDLTISHGRGYSSNGFGTNREDYS